MKVSAISLSNNNQLIYIVVVRFSLFVFMGDGWLCEQSPFHRQTMGVLSGYSYGVCHVVFDYSQFSD